MYYSIIGGLNDKYGSYEAETTKYALPTDGRITVKNNLQFMVLFVYFLLDSFAYLADHNFLISCCHFSMSSTATSGAVPGRAYERYSRNEVLELLAIDEPVLDDSDDDLGIELGSGDEL